MLRRSAIGVIATGRSRAQAGQGANQVFGVDGTFQFFTNLSINTYWAASRTEGVRGDDELPRAGGLRRRSLRRAGELTVGGGPLQSRGRLPEA
ncbi:MAG: hypothetical protein R2712_08445 [Vicinamibacterales bacterium]